MKLPKSPSSPAFVQIYQWANRPTKFLDSCKEYGDIFVSQWPGYGLTVFINNPQAIEEIFTAPTTTFSTAEIYEILRPILGDQSLMLMDGKPHRRQRSLMMPPLHGERMRSYGQFICELTEEMMERWQLGEVINLSAELQDLTLKIMFRVIFGSDEGELSVKLRQKIKEMLHCSSSAMTALHFFVKPLQKNLGPWSPWGRFIRLRNEVDRLLYAEIAQRRQQPHTDRADLLSLLMSARDEEDQPMSDHELRDEAMTVLTGKDSIFTAIICSLYSVYKHPEVCQRLQEELDNVSDPLNTNAIVKLPYLTATTQETMRLYPPVVVAMRVVRSPFEIMGYTFPVGSQIVADIYSVHQREDLFPKPKEFNPERFLSRQFSAYEYLPFGGGNRRCIGDVFAPFQVKLMLATIVSRYQLELTNNEPINPVRKGAGVAPDKDIYMRVASYHHQKENYTTLQSPLNLV